MEHWSAFPSDTATFFFALSFGLAQLCRRLYVPALLYTAFFICLPRLYLGLHYASDIVVGALIGLLVPYLILKSKRVCSSISTYVVSWADRRPSIFYPAAFLVSFQMCVLFDDVRLGAKTAYYMAIATRPHTLRLLGLMILGISGLLGAPYWRRVLKKAAPSLAPSTRVRAAEVIINQAAKGIEIEDIESRLTDLEQAAATQEQRGWR